MNFLLAVLAEALRANIEEEQSHGLLATAKRLTLLHRKARSGLNLLLGVMAKALPAKID